MPDNPLPQRKSPRFKGHDYRSANAYFVTICTAGRNCYFGEIQSSAMILNDWGKIADAIWQTTPQYFPEAKVDCYVVMPNHVHGLVFLDENARSLSDLIGNYKATVSRQINANHNPTKERIWQRSFHEHRVTNLEALQRIGVYIQTNPQLWQKDKLYR
jgi:putative transposase